MNPSYVYPRLPRSVARLLLEELEGKDLPAARAMAAASHPAAAPVATGGPHVPRERIERLAGRVRSLADELGHPAPLPRTGVVRFDQPCGEILLDEMRIVPADAASEDVWSFITLVVLPDIAIWRFPDLLQERFLGLPRNTFRRLWWRSFTLDGANADIPNGPVPLMEDALVAVFERPALSRSAIVTQAMTRAVRNVDEAGVSPTYAMRELAKRMRRLVSFIALDAIAPSELDAVISEQLTETIRALGGGSPESRAAEGHESSSRGERSAPPVTPEDSAEWRTFGQGQGETPPAEVSDTPRARPPVTDDDRIDALLAGETVHFIQRGDSGSPTVTADLVLRGRTVEITYSLRGHNAVTGRPRVYHHRVEGPTAALAWVRNEHKQVLAGKRPPPERDLRHELD